MPARSFAARTIGSSIGDRRAAQAGEEVAQAEGGGDVKPAAHDAKKDGESKDAQAKAGDGKASKDARAEKPKKKKKRRKKAEASP